MGYWSCLFPESSLIRPLWSSHSRRASGEQTSFHVSPTRERSLSGLSAGLAVRSRPIPGERQVSMRGASLRRAICARPQRSPAPCSARGTALITSELAFPEAGGICVEAPGAGAICDPRSSAQHRVSGLPALTAAVFPQTVTDRHHP